MTVQELRKRIESVCKENYEILDISFYSVSQSYKKNTKDQTKVVIVYVVKYDTFSDNIYAWSGKTVEEAILEFIDPDQLTAVSGSDIGDISSKKIESF